MSFHRKTSYRTVKSNSFDDATILLPDTQVDTKEDDITANTIIHRRRYNVSKRLVKLTRFKSFPLQLSGHQDIPPSSFVLRHHL